MTMPSRLNRDWLLLALVIVQSAHAAPSATGAWSDPAEVRHDDALCVSYQARLDGSYLVVRASLGPGWHTFAMDNKRRADEKLAGKPPLSIDRATEISSTAGLDIVGPWSQSPPKDFSRPELRWFSWGFEKQAFFVAGVRRSGEGPARIVIRGQTCQDTICKNIDVALSLRLAGVSLDRAAADIDLKSLVQVR
jgi:hypothetical protein